MKVPFKPELFLDLLIFADKNKRVKKIEINELSKSIIKVIDFENLVSLLLSISYLLKRK